MSISKSSVGFGVVLVLVVTCVKQIKNLGLGLSLEFDKLRCWMGGGNKLFMLERVLLMVGGRIRM